MHQNSAPKTGFSQPTSESYFPVQPGDVRGELPPSSTSAHAATFTRRAALRLLLGAGAAASVYGALPSDAYAADHSGVDAAQADLDSAQARYDEVQEQLDRLGTEFEELAKQQADTLDQIEQTQIAIEAKQEEIAAKQAEIDETELKIEELEAELEEKKQILSSRMSDAYKSGNRGVLEAVFSSRSLEDLVSNIHYLDRINEADAEMIAAVEATKEALDAAKAKLEEQKAALEQQEAELEEQKADLEALSAQQLEQLSAMKDKQAEVQEMLDSLEDDVRKLMEKRDAELLAYNRAQQAEAAAAASRAAAAALIARGGGEAAASTGEQQAVVGACLRTRSPGYGYCAMWVSLVFQNAGYRYIGGDACDMYNAYCYSSDKDELKVGMIIAVSTHNHTAAGRIWGHIGIYIGDGMMMDNIGSIRTINVDKWIDYYGTTVAPRWGWAGNIVLS